MAAVFSSAHCGVICRKMLAKGIGEFDAVVHHGTIPGSSMLRFLQCWQAGRIFVDRKMLQDAVPFSIYSDLKGILFSIGGFLRGEWFHKSQKHVVRGIRPWIHS